MELGEKLRQARQEAGLSQRQLCGDIITRNMLSLIEHGAARPSMDTLRCLASRLGKPVSYFLEEDAAVSPNLDRITAARAACRAGRFTDALESLKDFRQPDPVLDFEYRYLRTHAALEAAAQALAADKPLYARQLLEGLESCLPELDRRRLLLLGRLPDADLAHVTARLPSLDDELLLRSEAALAARDLPRAQALLSAAQDRTSPRWNLLQGKLYARQKQYAQAIVHLESAEPHFPAICCPLLEACFRDLGDFQKAYLYACKQR